MTDGKAPVQIQEGVGGEVTRVNDEGDVLIRFDGSSAGRRVFKAHFHRLRLKASCSNSFDLQRRQDAHLKGCGFCNDDAYVDDMKTLREKPQIDHRLTLDVK